MRSGRQQHAKGHQAKAKAADNARELQQYFRKVYGARWDALQSALMRPTCHVAALNSFAPSCQAAAAAAGMSALVALGNLVAYRPPSAHGPYTQPGLDPSTGLRTYNLMDLASLLPVLLLQPAPGAAVLDMCAASGGKSVLLAQMLFGRPRPADPSAAEASPSPSAQVSGGGTDGAAAGGAGAGAGAEEASASVSGGMAALDLTVSTAAAALEQHGAAAGGQAAVGRADAQGLAPRSTPAPHSSGSTGSSTATASCRPPGGAGAATANASTTTCGTISSASADDGGPGAAAPPPVPAAAPPPAAAAAAAAPAPPSSRSIPPPFAAAAAGRLVCNEPDRARHVRLQRTLEEYVPAAMRARVEAVNHHGHTYWLRNQAETYDAVLVDAPCSSDRHVLQAAAAQRGVVPASDWSLAACKRTADMQLQLCIAGLRALKVGGRLSYSTCSIVPQQNGGVVSRLLQRFPGSVRLLPALELLTQALGPEAARAFGMEAAGGGAICMPDAGAGWGPVYFAAVEKTGAFLDAARPRGAAGAAEEEEESPMESDDDDGAEADHHHGDTGGVVNGDDGGKDAE